MTDTLQVTMIGEQKLPCAGCEGRIRRALRRLPGVQEVEASAHTQQVTVVIDPGRASPDQALAKLEQLGYQLAP
jgi:copper chaperone CopZ